MSATEQVVEDVTFTLADEAQSPAKPTDVMLAPDAPPTATAQRMTAVAIDPLLALIERVLLDPALDVAKLDQLLAVRERYEAAEQRKAFVAAMAAFKANPPHIVKDKRVFFPGRDGKPATEFWHASLGSIADAVSKAMAAHGLAFRWDVQQDLKDGGRVTVSCILSHSAGHEERRTLSGSPDTTGSKNNIQAVGSTVSYLQRYTLVAAAGLAAFDIGDDDGAGAAPATVVGTDSDTLQPLREQIEACDSVPKLKALFLSMSPFEQRALTEAKNSKYRRLTMPQRKGASDARK